MSAIDLLTQYFIERHKIMDDVKSAVISKLVTQHNYLQEDAEESVEDYFEDVDVADMDTLNPIGVAKEIADADSAE